MSKKKKRVTKRIYLIREIEELWKRLQVDVSLRINKIRAHCLEMHDADFTFAQVRDALWTFFARVNGSNGTGDLIRAVPEEREARLIGLIKIGDTPYSRQLLEDYRKRVAGKDRKRNAAHKKYVENDYSCRLLTKSQVHKILDLAGISPSLKELPEHHS